MFLTSQGFKKLINEAYKGEGLRIGNDRKGNYLAGGYWAVWVENGCIPKKELASIIELTGEMPEAGQGFRATKAGNQYELPWNEVYMVMDNAEKCDAGMDITPLILKYKDGVQARILQSPENGTIVLINEKFIDMIDNTVVDYESGETQAEGPMISGRIQGIFWKNNTMALHVYPRTDDENKKLLGYLEAFDIMDAKEETEDEH